MATEETRLGQRYVLESRIARGGMGSVWRARDDVLARTVAVKVLHPSLSDDDDFIERFRREAYAAASLTHPNIVAIYDTGHDESAGGPGRPEATSHYIVMEYCSRGALDDLLRSEGSLEPERVLSIGSKVCSALGYAHRAGVIHRDVKPANVLIAEDGSLKVADFGIAKAAFAAGDITTTGVILGTVTHISPEQARGEDPDARSDLYATGVLLYELLVGRPPFMAETEIGTAIQHLHDEPPPPRSIKPRIPKKVEEIVLKALEKDPDDRYSSAEEMRAAIDSARGTWAVDAVDGGYGWAAPAADVVDDEAAEGDTLRTQRLASAAPLDEAGGAGPRSGAQPAGPVGSFPAGAGRRAWRGNGELPGAPGEAAHSRTGPRRRGAAIAAAALLVAAIGVATFLSVSNEDVRGGQNRGKGGSGRRDSGGSSGDLLAVQGAADLDPYGDNEEHSDEVGLSTDNNPQTAWETENYRSSLELLGKPGVGLVFDLGNSRTVGRVEVMSNDPGYSLELRQSDTQASDDTGFQIVDDASGAPPVTSFEFDPVEARYWLVWITQLPGGDGGSASISEVKFFES
jgi:eukaryotic-like serine/threonine-protein kinase